MINKICISDFRFEFSGYGHYKVTYTSPVTRKSWSVVTNDMRIIDDTKNADDPKKSRLNDLKKLCKSN